ncbi:transcriptional regulator [Asticcacaulis sp.]|uniref:transcriptional regulator n=1 Tax=Asticcacaulis sp. TaxID=1872648 RepID=UPI00391A8164
MSPTEALHSALAAAGGQSGLARICGVSQTAVWKWLRQAGQISAEHCITAAEATGVSAHDLRPDIYPRSKVRFLSGEPNPGPEPISAAVAAGYGKSATILPLTAGGRA